MLLCIHGCGLSYIVFLSSHFPSYIRNWINTGHNNKSITKRHYCQSKHGIHFPILAKCKRRINSKLKVILWQTSNWYPCLGRAFEYLKQKRAYYFMSVFGNFFSFIFSGIHTRTMFVIIRWRYSNTFD